MARAETIEEIKCGGHPNGTTYGIVSTIPRNGRGYGTDISAHADDAASEANISALTSGTATTRPILVARIHGPADDVIDGFTDHQSLGHTRLDVENSTSLSEQSHEHRVLLVILANPGHIGHTRFEPLLLSEVSPGAASLTYLDAELVLE